MKELGIFGLAIPEPYGEAPVSMPCYVEVTTQLARGWMSLAGAMGGHTVVSKLLLAFGTEEQRERYLPDMATGEIRATGAVPVRGPSGQVGTLHGLAGTSALHRRGVHDPHVIAPQCGVPGQRAGDTADEFSGLPQPLVVAGLLGQIGEQVSQVGAGVPQPPGHGGETEHRLHHRQGHQLRIAELRRDTDGGPPRYNSVFIHRGWALASCLL